MAQRFVNEKVLLPQKAFMEIAADEGSFSSNSCSCMEQQHDFVASTIVGATKADQMKEIIEAGPMKISAETNRRIDQVSKEIMYQWADAGRCQRGRCLSRAPAPFIKPPL